jgi:hypothetical protein
MLFLSPVQLILSFYLAVIYGVLFLLLATLPAVYIRQYRFSEGLSGIPYMLVGVVAVITMGLMGIFSDRVHQKLLTMLNRGKSKPE